MMQEPISDDVKDIRKPEFPIHSQFLNRWSPRAMTGDPMTKEELFSLLEAAKWAPSSYNSQPWRFAFALNGDENWSTFLNFLVPFNQSWANKASALIVMISKKTFEQNGKPSVTHSFDTGAAWGYLALQGDLNDLVVHGMSGFDYDKVKKELNISEDFQVEAMAAIGKRAPKESLPHEMQDKEAPSTRKTLQEILFDKHSFS